MIKKLTLVTVWCLSLLADYKLQAKDVQYLIATLGCLSYKFNQDFCWETKELQQSISPWGRRLLLLDKRSYSLLVKLSRQYLSNLKLEWDSKREIRVGSLAPANDRQSARHVSLPDLPRIHVLLPLSLSLSSLPFLTRSAISPLQPSLLLSGWKESKGGWEEERGGIWNNRFIGKSRISRARRRLTCH